MTITEGVIVGMVANILYQGIILSDEYGRAGRWPWNHPGKQIRKAYFFCGCVLKAMVAGFIVWALVKTEQVNGIGGVIIIAPVADEVFKKIVASGRRTVR
ncbi:hypothetical protein JNJ66_02760 [Candidatus Saccharibacteria bacterium]|nr:hypothetical protein [Candidatus Saccharibacteria bacterium]